LGGKELGMLVIEVILDLLELVKAGTTTDGAGHGEILVLDQQVDNKIPNPVVFGYTSIMTSLELTPTIKLKLRRGGCFCNNVRVYRLECDPINPRHGIEGPSERFEDILRLPMLIGMLRMPQAALPQKILIF
jgi:hypothetical protein